MVEKVDWKSLGVNPQHVHPDGFGVNYRSQLYGIAYNRKLVPDDVGRKLNWEDSRGSQVEEKGGDGFQTASLRNTLAAQRVGTGKTLAHARQLAANETIFERDRTGAMTKLALGEYAIDCGSFYSTYYEQTRSGKGEPIGFTLP